MKTTIALLVILSVVCSYGWVNNIYRLAVKDDFKAPYKAEVFRVVGIPFAPLGIVLGFVTFDKETAR